MYMCDGFDTQLTKVRKSHDYQATFKLRHKEKGEYIAQALGNGSVHDPGMT